MESSGIKTHMHHSPLTQRTWESVPTVANVSNVTVGMFVLMCHGDSESEES